MMQEVLTNTSKSDIKSVRVLGEGAFGIVDLVLIDNQEVPLLCVRKKLLKQGERNVNNPELEVRVLASTCKGAGA